MSQLSSIFINEPTIVDHSYIDQTGRIVGGSINPSFIVTGQVTSDENVVLDFSTAKKRIKDLIDDDDNGFDHKCWVIQGFSNLVYVVEASTNSPLSDWGYLSSSKDPNLVIEVSTSEFSIKAPKSAFRFVERNEIDCLRTANEYIEAAMRDWLEFNMPGFEVVVEIREHAIPFNEGSEVEMFRYVHGLKRSSSWGCQNIAHGHLSFIDFDCIPNGAHPELIQSTKASIARQLNDTIFISAENLSQDEHTVKIGYESTTRGRFEMTLKRGAQQKFVVLETETTIEHIIEYVAARFESQLQSVSATTLYVSEGLNKGAALKLEYN